MKLIKTFLLTFSKKVRWASGANPLAFIVIKDNAKVLEQLLKEFQELEKEL